MAAIDRSKVKRIIVKKILEHATIKSTASTRVYPAHLATIESPEFPCICFEFAGSGAKDVGDYARAFNCTMNVWCYGEVRKGYEIPQALHRYLIDQLDLQDIQDTTFSINVICKKVSDPAEYIDPDSNNPYVFCRWEVTAFGS